MKLKTLKEFNIKIDTKNINHMTLINLVPIYDLKQEAIKWIKELDSKIYSTYGYSTKHKDNSITLVSLNRIKWMGAKEILIDFFNISDKEVADKK